MIPICAVYLSKIFPEAKIVLPNEVNKTLLKDYDFLFLTTTRIDFITKELYIPFDQLPFLSGNETKTNFCVL